MNEEGMFLHETCIRDVRFSARLLSTRCENRPHAQQLNAPFRSDRLTFMFENRDPAVFLMVKANLVDDDDIRNDGEGKIQSK